MTHNAIDSLKMNLKGFQDMMFNILNKPEVYKNMKWSKLSSFECERLFSLVRRKNNKVSSEEIGPIIGQVSGERTKQLVGKNLGFNIMGNNGIYSQLSDEMFTEVKFMEKLQYKKTSPKKKEFIVQNTDPKILKETREAIKVLMSDKKKRSKTVRDEQRQSFTSDSKIQKKK